MTAFSSLQQYGLKNGFKRALKRILRFFGIKIEIYLGYSQVLGNLKSTDLQINPNYKIVKLTLNDFVNSLGLKFSTYKLNLFQKRFESKSYEAYGVTHGDVLIYSSWISTQILPNSGDTLGIELQRNEGLLLDIETHSSYRRQGLHNYMNIYCLKKLRQIGVKRAVVFVLKENIPAIKSQERSGFRKKMEVKIVQIWGKKKTIIKLLNH